MTTIDYNVYKQIPLELVKELLETSYKKGKSRHLISELYSLLRHIELSEYDFELTEHLFNVPVKEIKLHYRGLRHSYFIIQKDGETYFWKGYFFDTPGDVTFDGNQLRMQDGYIYNLYNLKKRVFKLQADYSQINDPITGIIDAIASVPGNPRHTQLLKPYTQLLESYQNYAPSLF